MKSPEHKAEMEARAARRAARKDRQLQRRANQIAARELANRIDHAERMNLDAKGDASKHATAVGTPNTNPVTPPSQDGEHD